MNLLAQIFGAFAPPPTQRRPHRPPRRNPASRHQKSPAKRPIWKRLFQAPSASHGTLVAFHGTPSAENARSILRHGWMVSRGNALGDGVYLAQDLATAKSHAGTGGVYIKCRVRLGRTCVWTSRWQAEFDRWCKARAVVADNSARTAFLLRRGSKTLQSGKVVVVLAAQVANPTAWKLRQPRIRVLSIHRAADDRPIRV